MKGDGASAFRLWRIQLGWTQEQAANELGYSRRVLAIYDRGEKAPPRVMILAMERLSERYEDTITRRQNAA